VGLVRLKLLFGIHGDGFHKSLASCKMRVTGLIAWQKIILSSDFLEVGGHHEQGENDPK
jgi:hypothetical protein